MPRQIMGYYSSRKEQLLKDFDRISALMKDSLIARYGEDFATTLQTEAHQEYEQLIPEIPYITGVRAKALNSFLLGTAQELAAMDDFAAQDNVMVAQVPIVAGVRTIYAWVGDLFAWLCVTSLLGGIGWGMIRSLRH